MCFDVEYLQFLFYKFSNFNASYIRVTIERGGFKYSKKVWLIDGGG